MPRGAKIGENRFRKHVELCTAEREDRLLSIVIDIQRSKILFRSLTSMSHYVAKKFNESECSQGKKITNTTILRNPRYRDILLRLYLGDTQLIGDNKTTSENLQLRLENERIKNALMKADLEIRKLESALEEKKRNSNFDANGFSITNLDACYKIILSILEASNGVYVITENGIIDKSNIFNNVVVSKKLLNLSGIEKYQQL
jgi:hypothetical protein